MIEQTIFVSIAPSRGRHAQICWQVAMDEQARVRFRDLLTARGRSFPVGGALIYGRRDQLAGALPHGGGHAECYQAGHTQADWVIWHVCAGGALDIPSTGKSVGVEPLGARICEPLDRNGLTEAECNTLRQLRDRGFAAAVFNPTELRGADPGRVQDRLIELGWEVIDDLAPDRFSVSDAEQAWEAWPLPAYLTVEAVGSWESKVDGRGLVQCARTVFITDDRDLRSGDTHPYRFVVRRGSDTVEAMLYDPLGQPVPAIAPPVDEDRTQDEEGGAACRPS